MATQNSSIKLFTDALKQVYGKYGDTQGLTFDAIEKIFQMECDEQFNNEPNSRMKRIDEILDT